MSRPRHGVAVHPDDDLWDVDRRRQPPGAGRVPGDPREIAGVGLCTIRCCKAFLRADGSLVEPVISWMDDRAYQPYLPDDPDARLRDDLVGLPHPSPDRRAPRHRGQQHPAAVADRHRHLALERRRRRCSRSSASPGRCSSSSSCPATIAGT